MNRKLVVTALIQHWWGHWWWMTQITTHTCIPGDSGQNISTIIASTANRHPGSLWCYLHLLKRKLELQEIKFLAHYWLKSEAELGFNPNLLVYNPWVFFFSLSHWVIKGHVHKLAHAPNLKSHIISSCPKYALNTGPVPLGEKKSVRMCFWYDVNNIPSWATEAFHFELISWQ